MVERSPRRRRTNRGRGTMTVATVVSKIIITTTALTTPTKRFRVRRWRSPRAGAGYRAGSWVTSGRQQGFTKVPAGSHRRARLRNAEARLPRSPRGHHAPRRTERSASPSLSLGSKLGWARRLCLAPPLPTPAACGAPPSDDGGALRS
jgi:hypothetical protein